ncbi:MAG TPA: translation initiation factor IF-3 [Chroococcales cyanobacterium]
MTERQRDRSVRLQDLDGSDLGILPTAEALALASERGLELFVLDPNATPPLARLMDYGQFKYEQEKKAREIKRKYGVRDIKEINLRCEIAENDYQVKLRAAKEFLVAGDKVKVLVVLRGRELQNKEPAIALMTRFAGDLSSVGNLDGAPQIQGKRVLMELSPKTMNLEPPPRS